MGFAASSTAVLLCSAPGRIGPAGSDANFSDTFNKFWSRK